jgi:hypothetical protein
MPRSNSRWFVAHSAAQFAGNLHGFDDRLDAGPVFHLAAARTVEIDQVQAPGALAGPMARHGRGILSEHGFATVISLPQPHALAAA